jgi:hypothetical protein
VHKPADEAHDTAVEVQHPLVLLDRGAQHLDEIPRRLDGSSRVRAAISRRIESLWARLNSGSRNGVIVKPTASCATDRRIWSYSLVPTAILTAARAGPAARSIAGPIAVSSICLVRSPRGPSSRKLPMFSSVTTSSAMIPA